MHPVKRINNVSQHMESCFPSDADKNEYSYNHLNISELIYKLTLQPIS